MISMQRAHNAANAKKKPIMCMLEETKYCDDCCECFTCEIDASKICNNCADCVKLTVFGSRLMRVMPQEIKQSV